VDQIIAPRLGTKGIIHTVSYARRDMVLGRSKFAEHMMTHDRKDTEDTVKRFKREEAPCILVSPSMATGWDFPDAQCRWQIIIKLPYPDTRGPIMKERSKRDKDYSSYITMQQLIQATGRGVRNETDFCETFILDNNVSWFLTSFKHLSVKWFNDAFQTRNTLPLPNKGV
jgi:Rad3-related DNA helicase